MNSKISAVAEAGAADDAPPWWHQWRVWRDQLLGSARFHRFAAAFPLTRPIARRRARGLFDLMAGFVYSQVLMACVQLRLFDILAEGPQSLQALCRRLDLAEPQALRLLSAAVALDLVERRGAAYGLGSLGAVMVGNTALVAMIEHHASLYRDLADPVARLTLVHRAMAWAKDQVARRGSAATVLLTTPNLVPTLLLSMLVPILLVLGAPMTLALRALDPAGRGEPPGLREWILAALHSRVSRFLTHPVVATVLFVAGFYGLYFSSLFDAAVGSHAGHVAMNIHFLMSGYLFYWVVIGVDPTPRPIPPLGKLGMVFASLPLHAFFGVVLMGTQEVLGERFYRSLQLPWHTDLLGDQQLGGGIAWSAGEVPLVPEWRRGL